MNIREEIGKRPWILALAIFGLVTVWMLTGTSAVEQINHRDAATERSKPRLTSVRVDTRHAEPIVRHVIVNGRTEPSRIVELNAETVGRVVKVVTQRGERVKSGTTIVRLDGRDRQARLDQARATLKQREIEYQAKLELHTEGYVSDTQLAEGVALLESAKTELRRAELDLQYMTIRAPFDGSLQDLMVEVGDYVKVGDPVAEFVDNETLIVSGTLNENERGRLHEGTMARAELVTGATVEGRVRYVAPVADQATRTFRVELELDNRAEQLPSGVTAELRIPVGTVLAHKISPALLSLDDDGNLGVKVLGPGDTVEFHIADIAVYASDGVWLVGLPEVTTFITVGQAYVRQGESVVAVPEEPDNTAVAAETLP